MPSDRLHNRIRVDGLVVCSVCLRVREGGAWIEAGHVIRRLRTYEHEDVVRLDGALCQGCRTELRLRRRSGSEARAA